ALPARRPRARVRHALRRLRRRLSAARAALRGGLPSLLGGEEPPPPRQGACRREDAQRAEPDGAVAVCELDGARGLRPVRAPLRGSSRPGADPALRRMRGAPAAQGLPEGAAPAARGPEELMAHPHFPSAPLDSPDDFERDLHTEHQLLNMGPSHPATHGTVKFLVELDGENIVNIDIQVGYLHRGFEKECESGTWYQAIPYTDRLNYNSAVLANLGVCMAVAKLLRIET